MGIFDKAKDALSEHEAQVGVGIDKAGDLLDQRTGGKYVSEVDKAQEIAKEQLGNYLNREDAPPAAPAAPDAEAAKAAEQ